MNKTDQFRQNLVFRNSLQGEYKRVLCVCTAGVLRSPTAAEVLSRDPFNHNTRSAGVDTSVALVPVTQNLIDWADEVVCMEMKHLNALLNRFDLVNKSTTVLHIPDEFDFRHPNLVEMITQRYSIVRAK